VTSSKIASSTEKLTPSEKLKENPRKINYKKITKDK
jgi:hypothetical protein